MMKFLCTPRLSWIVLIGLMVALWLISGYPNSKSLNVGALAFLAVCLVIDWAAQMHQSSLRARQAAEKELERQAKEQMLLEDPSVTGQLRNLCETVTAQEHELDSLSIELKIAIAEKQKAEEEREDIRQVFSFNRTALHASQAECQDLRERLAKLQGAAQ